MDDRCVAVHESLAELAFVVHDIFVFAFHDEDALLGGVVKDAQRLSEVALREASGAIHAKVSHGDDGL